MGHGKETPRQKMIGMMYLVLTAMLAMNVSVEVLDAFVLVDEGLNQTTKNYKIKNNRSFSELEFLNAQNPAKVGPWLKKADSVRSLSKEIFEYSHSLKLELLADENEAVHEGEIHPDKIAAKSDMDIGTRIMHGLEESHNGKGYDLQKMIENYRKYLISCIENPEKDTTLVHTIEKLLDTHDPPKTEDGITHTWVTEHFAHIPLVAVLPMLTKTQVDVLNAEAEMINYLTSQVNAGGFNVNAIEARVIQNSNYILKGNEYQAEVFMAAFDTTQQPEVLVGKYDSTEISPGAGVYNYFMVGNNYEKLDVVKGKGIIKRTENSVGSKSWGGLIRIKKDDGTYIARPFKSRYDVAEASIVISPSKMNVFYRGVNNPIEVSVPGVDPSNLSVSVSSGDYRKDANGFIIIPAQGQFCEVRIYAQIDGQKKSMGSKQFRIKDVPNPFPRVINLPTELEKEATIARLRTCPGVEAAMPEDFDFDLNFRIQGFRLSAIIGGYESVESSESNAFTQRQKDLLFSLRPGSRVTIEGIRAIGPDGKVRNLNDINLKIK